MNTLSVTILFIICGRVFNYGTSIITPNVNPDEDARAIFEAPDRDAKLISILPYRTLIQRKQIFQKYKQLNPQSPLVPDEYVPFRGEPFQDLLFAMSDSTIEFVAKFLHAALRNTALEGLRNVAIEILIFMGDIKEELISKYNRHPSFQGSLFEIASTITENNYRHFIQQLLKREREQESLSWHMDVKEIKRLTRILTQESKDWAINRTTLDYILMDKSIGFAGPLIFLFTRENNNQDIFEAFDQHIDDETLKFGYKTLVNYIMSGKGFMVERILDSVNEPFDRHITNIILIASFFQSELFEMDDIFKYRHEKCICEYLLYKNRTDRVNQMLAAMAAGGFCETKYRGICGLGEPNSITRCGIFLHFH